jgi:hypothetical protein
VSNTEVLKAEIIWALKIAGSHLSFNASNEVSGMFKLMFPDSEIAARFRCGEDKVAYMISFGLGPYFSSALKENIHNADEYVLLFDESLNKANKKKQLDIHARFWKEGVVMTKYICSEMMGHATARDLLETLFPVVIDLGTRKLAQISMDGPNVNWKLFELLCHEIETHNNNTKKPINIGSCGLHVTHNAFSRGCTASGWKIGEILSAMFWLFHDTPARVEDYVHVTKSEVLPQRFCKHRWLENVSVMQRAIDIYPNLKLYVKTVRSGKLPNPKTKSFETVCEAMADPLFMAKGHSFISIASEVEPFLKAYQTDQPMLPFLAADLFSLAKSVLQRFMKDSVMDEIKNPRQLFRLIWMINPYSRMPARSMLGLWPNNNSVNFGDRSVVRER